MRGHGRRTTASRRAIAPGMAITRAPWLSAPAAQHADSHRGEWRATPDNSRCGETHARSSIALRPHAPHGVSDPEAESRAYPERLATRTVSSPGPVMCRTSSRSEGPRSVEQPAAPYATLRLRSLYARRRPPPRPSDTLRERRFGRRGHVAHAFGGTRRRRHWWCRPVAVQARPVQGRCSATRASRWRTPSTQEVADTPVASQPADCMRSASSSESPRSCAMSRSTPNDTKTRRARRGIVMVEEARVPTRTGLARRAGAAGGGKHDAPGTRGVTGATQGVPATAYSPAISRPEYHRRCQA
jgi:hypothetical protein